MGWTYFAVPFLPDLERNLTIDELTSYFIHALVKLLVTVGGERNGWDGPI